MKRSLRVLATVAAVWCASTTVVTAQVKTDAPLPTHQQLSRLGLERAWWAQAVLNPHRDKITHISIDEEIIYVQANSGIVTAFDSETGQQMWAVQLGKFDEPSFPAVSNEDQALIIVGGSMYSLKKTTGRTLWTLVLPGAPSTGPAVDDRRVYFGTLDGSLYAYSLETIRKLYEERRLPQWSMEAQVWKFKAGKEITSPPITTGRVVNFASRDGSLYSVAAIDRKMVYQLETDKPIVAPLGRQENMMYMASEDNTFQALNLFNGKVEWEFTSGLPIRKAPIPIGSNLYLMPDRGGMYCLDSKTGFQRWWHDGISNFCAVVGSNVVASDVDGNLVLMSSERGQLIGTLPLRRYSVRTGNDRTDRVYLSTESGLLICLRQTGHQFPVYYRHPDRLPLLPELSPESSDDAAGEAAAEAQ